MQEDKLTHATTRSRATRWSQPTGDEPVIGRRVLGGLLLATAAGSTAALTTACGGATAAASKGLPTLAINNVAISVSDINRAVAWYRDVLGFTLASRTQFPPVSAEVAFMSRPGFSIELLQVPANYAVPDLLVDPPAHLKPRGYKAMVFDVDDLAEATAELELAKVTILWKQQVIDPSTGLTSTLIRDLDGNLINIFQKQKR
jgi:catechol 2,3-dioxygenase-like lactoylglutathione lyase family enzyme